MLSSSQARARTAPSSQARACTALLLLTETLLARGAVLSRFATATHHGRARALVAMSSDEMSAGPLMNPNRNVLGADLECCCADVRGTGIGTGYYRNGLCATGQDDTGRHTVCIEATAEFLAFSRSVGNDLSRPMPEYMFPGVNPGDRWCLCAARWKQALDSGKAPRLFLASTHEKTLQYAPLEVLKQFAVDVQQAEAELAKLDSLRESLSRSIKFDSA